MCFTQMTKMLASHNVDTETVTRNEYSRTSLKQMQKRETLSSGIKDTKKKQMINLEQKK